MTIIDSAGSSIDREIWSQLMGAGDENLSHRLWVAVIYEVAEAAAEQNLKTQNSHESNSTRTSREDIEDLQQELLNTWLSDSLPADDLIDIVGDSYYFIDMDLSWDEKISFSGEACKYTDVVCCDLKEMLDCYPDAQDAITEDRVESFYMFWRTRFCKTVLNAAMQLK
jgi:hypothetical protein